MNDQQFVIKVNVETDDGSEIIATMKELYASFYIIANRPCWCLSFLH
jgi:hypothetical protein